MGAKTIPALSLGAWAFKALGTPSISANNPKASLCRSSESQRINFFLNIMDFGSYTTALDNGPHIVSDNRAVRSHPRGWPLRMTGFL
jgi:hypothetical protein